MQKTESIWRDGRMVPWDDARIHVLSHVVHYGSAVFEGIRCYRTHRGAAIFRLQDHMRRLRDSARIYRMAPEHDAATLCAAAIETVRANHMEECYIRPVVLRGYGSMGVDPSPCPVETWIAVWPWGAYLGEDALKEGVDVMVSSWNRIAPNTLPALAKAAANYMNAQLIKMEALGNGYAEAVALDSNGFVSEGSGENIFVVQDGTLLTPPLGNSILPGITRDTVLALAREIKLPVAQRRIPREQLYIADEVFLTGTAAEITPVRSVDRQPVGTGRPGPVTQQLQEAFFGLFDGRTEDRHEWLTPVAPPA